MSLVSAKHTYRKICTKCGKRQDVVIDRLEVMGMNIPEEYCKMVIPTEGNPSYGVDDFLYIDYDEFEADLAEEQFKGWTEVFGVGARCLCPECSKGDM